MPTQLSFFNTTGKLPSNQDNTTSPRQCQEKSSFRYKNQKRKFFLKIYPHCVEYKTTTNLSGPRKYKRSHRGKIFQFSNRSRFRLLQLMAKLKKNIARKPLFFTLTYHHGHNFEENIHQKHLHTFLTQLRSYDHQVQYIWRLEYQKRGAPHFHLIVFPGGIFDYDHYFKYIHRCSRIWHKISDPISTAHKKYGFKSVEIKSYLMACAYVSKYVAKIDDDFSKSTQGKQYGNSRNVPVSTPLVIELTEAEAYSVIFHLRNFMKEKVKGKYDNSLFFNHELDQFVFIEVSMFKRMECWIFKDPRLSSEMPDSVPSDFDLTCINFPYVPGPRRF